MYFSLFLANDLFTRRVFYIYFSLWKWCQTKSKFERFSYLSSKWIIKRWRQLTTSTMHLAQELLTNIQCHGQFKLCKGDESLEEEEHSGQPSEVDNKNWEPSSKLILLQLHEKLPKNSMSTIVWLFHIWNKLERWKSLISGCLVGWLQIKKIIILKCHLLLFYTTNHFLIRLWCATKSGFHTTCDNPLSGCNEKQLQSTSQSQTCTQKRSSPLVVCCPSDSLQLSESWWNHYIWEACSANQRDAPKTVTPAAGIGQCNGPRSSWQRLTTGLTTSASKV